MSEDFIINLLSYTLAIIAFIIVMCIFLSPIILTIEGLHIADKFVTAYSHSHNYTKGEDHERDHRLL